MFHFHSILGIGNICSGLTIIVNGTVSTITPLISSIYGGAILKITGFGFSSNISQIQINIGSNLCPVISATNRQINCTIPMKGNNSNLATINIISHRVIFSSSFILGYNETVTPNVTSINPTFGNGSSQLLTIYGENFVSDEQTTVTVGEHTCIVSNYSAMMIQCTLDSTLPAGDHAVIVHVYGIGDSNSNIFYTHDLSLTTVTPSEGGFGGGLQITIIGYGFNSTDTSVTICSQACSSITILSNVELVCLTPQVSPDIVDSSCNLTATSGGISKRLPFTFRANLTSTIASVGPSRGGTGGGTMITINGSNFP